MKTLLKIATIGVTLVAAIPAAAKDWKKLTIATEGAFAPYNFTKPDGTLDGLEVDLYKDICARMKVECTMIAQNWDGIIPGLLAGKYDAIMAGMSATDKRKEVIAFSVPYASTGQAFAVMKGSDLESLPLQGELFNLLSNPEGAADAIEQLRPKFEGKTIGVQGSSIGAGFIKDKFGDIADVREYKATEQHDLDLSSGRLDMIMASPGYLKSTIDSNPDSGMIMVGPRFQGGILGNGSSVGLRKEDTELKAMFDEALAAAKEDGTMKKLSEKWFGFDVTVY